MGRKISVESDSNGIEIENNQKAQKKVQREKKIQKVSKMETEGGKDSLKEKRIRSQKAKESREIQKQDQEDLQNPQLFKNFMSSLKKEQQQSMKIQKDKQKKKKLSKKEVLKNKLQSKMNFRKLVTEKSSQVKKTKEDTLKRALEFQGFDSEFGNMEAMNEKELEQLKYQQAKGTSNKQKNKIQNNEIKRMKTVLKFQPFLNDPLAALKQHIENNQAQK